MQPGGRYPRLDDAFDTDLANDMARLESYNKHLYRPNTYLHKWWARRCGSTFRLILKHLVSDETKWPYEVAGGLEGTVILDPMMGGGTTLHEAIRLGANVIGVDIDPIPVLQARATLTAVPLAHLQEAFDELYDSLSADLAPFFSATCSQCQQPAAVRFTLYGLKRYCRCGPAYFLDSFNLRYESDGRWIAICPRCHAVGRQPDHCHCQNLPGLKPPLVKKGTKQCPTCGERYRDDLNEPFYRRYAPLVVVSYCPEHGLVYAPPSAANLACIAQADAIRATLNFETDASICPGPKSADLIKHGVASYLDLFSSRQLLYLRRAMDLLPRFEPIVRLNLALLISTSLEFNAMLCGYKGGTPRRPGAIRHTFSHHAYSFPYTALENNPLIPAKASGTLQKLFHDRIRRARQWAARPRERIANGRNSRPVFVPGEVDTGVEVTRPEKVQSGARRFWLAQGSAARLALADESVDYVVTDPPYFDSVQYSDLGAFFRVWLQQMVPDTADWRYDVGQSAVAANGNSSTPLPYSNGHYTAVLSDIFRECRRVLRKENGRLVFTFHHWNPMGWAALTVALQRAGFRLINRYVVHSENAVSVHIANLKALTHDAILVLAPPETGIRKAWPRPQKINRRDSERFCYDCASALGWLLSADLNEGEINRLWREWLTVKDEG